VTSAISAATAAGVCSCIHVFGSLIFYALPYYGNMNHIDETDGVTIAPLPEPREPGDDYGSDARGLREAAKDLNDDREKAAADAEAARNEADARLPDEPPPSPPSSMPCGRSGRRSRPRLPCPSSRSC
jgi:hypothetical protein